MLSSMLFPADSLITLSEKIACSFEGRRDRPVFIAVDKIIWWLGSIFLYLKNRDYVITY